MNSINFFSGDKFPMYREALAKMQDMIVLVSQLAELGGKHYIVSGCSENEDGTLSDGLIVVDGELMPFIGGVKKTWLTIKETRLDEEAFNIVYPETYINRIAQLADIGEYHWDEFGQVITLNEIKKTIAGLRGEEPGFSKTWSGRIDRLPDKYMLADGRVMKTAEYPDLAWFYGKENEESFMLPDMSGMFIVGYDPNNSKFDTIGKTGGSETVTLTIDEMPEHSHPIGFTDEKWGDNANTRPYPNASATSSYSALTKPVGGGKPHQNLPPFYTQATVIRVKY